MMRALGKNGGVMGVNFYAAYVNEEDADGARKLITLWVDSAHHVKPDRSSFEFR